MSKYSIEMNSSLTKDTQEENKQQIEPLASSLEERSDNSRIFTFYIDNDEHKMPLSSNPEHQKVGYFTMTTAFIYFMMKWFLFQRNKLTLETLLLWVAVIFNCFPISLSASVAFLGLGVIIGEFWYIWENPEAQKQPYKLEKLREGVWKSLQPTEAEEIQGGNIQILKAVEFVLVGIFIYISIKFAEEISLWGIILLIFGLLIVSIHVDIMVNIMNYYNKVHSAATVVLDLFTQFSLKSHGMSKMKRKLQILQNYALRTQNLIQPIEATESLGFLTLIVVYFFGFWTNISWFRTFIFGSSDALSEYLFGGDTNSCILFACFVLLTIHSIFLCLKLQLAHISHEIFEANKERIKEVRSQIIDFKMNPIQFIRFKESKQFSQQDMINLEDIEFNHDFDKDYLDLKPINPIHPIYENVFNQICKDLSETSMKYKKLIKRIREQCSDLLERFDHLEKEYDNFHELIEYKFLGCVKIDKGVLLGLLGGIFSGVATYAYSYINNHLLLLYN